MIVFKVNNKDNRATSNYVIQVSFLVVDLIHIQYTNLEFCF